MKNIIASEQSPASVPEQLRRFLELRANPVKPRLTCDESREITRLEVSAMEFRREGAPYSRPLRRAAKQDLAQRLDQAKTRDEIASLRRQISEFDDVANLMSKKFRREAGAKVCEAVLILRPAIDRELSRVLEYRERLASVDLADLGLAAEIALLPSGQDIAMLEQALKLCDAVRDGDGDLSVESIAAPFGYNFAQACAEHEIAPPKCEAEFGKLMGAAEEITSYSNRFGPEAHHSAAYLRELERDGAKQANADKKRVPRTMDGAVVEEPVGRGDL